jgi:hypothetical protein
MKEFNLDDLREKTTIDIVNAIECEEGKFLYMSSIRGPDASEDLLYDKERWLAKIMFTAFIRGKTDRPVRGINDFLVFFSNQSVEFFASTIAEYLVKYPHFTYHIMWGLRVMPLREEANMIRCKLVEICEVCELCGKVTKRAGMKAQDWGLQDEDFKQAFYNEIGIRLAFIKYTVTKHFEGSDIEW